MEIIIIAAIDLNSIIGNNGNMLWHLPNDIKRFKKFTLNNIVIMGRKTFESIKNKPLYNRENIIITNNKKYYFPGIKINNSLKETIFSLKKNKLKKVFIIGGGEIYKQSIKYANILYITIIHHKFEGNIKFPKISLLEWDKKDEFFFKKDKDHLYNYSYITFIRNNNKL